MTRDKAPCSSCSHSAGGCKVRSVCAQWADWEQRKALRYADNRRARSVQVEAFALSRDVFRRALANR